MGALVLGFALSLVLTPPLGLKLSLPVDGLVGVTSGLGDALDELEEVAGLDFTGAGVDELAFAEAGVDETGPAGWTEVHDATGAVG